MVGLGVEAIPASQQQLFLRRFVTVSAELSGMSREWLELLLEFLSGTERRATLDGCVDFEQIGGVE